jgi:hypothetical protein
MLWKFYKMLIAPKTSTSEKWKLQLQEDASDAGA